MRYFVLAAFTLVLSTFSAPLAAQDYNTILDIPEGQTLVNLSASEMVEIDQDLLIANLRYESQNKDAVKLQDDINEIMTKALDEAKKYSDIKASTQQYHVYATHPAPPERGQLPNPEDRIWNGQQGLMLKSKNSTDLLKLTGSLQKMGLSMTGLSYTVSPELLEETRESLLEGALAKLQAKAERAAKALGKTKAELLEVNVDMGGYYPQPMMDRAMAMGAEMSMMKMDAPVAAPGQSQINLSVSARAILKP